MRSRLHRRLTALVLSWTFPATTAWAASPVVVVQPATRVVGTAAAIPPIPRVPAPRVAPPKLEVGPASIPRPLAASWEPGPDPGPSWDGEYERNRDRHQETHERRADDQQDPPPALEAGIQVFGPKRYTRTTGPKNVYTDTVSVPAWVEGPFVLHVDNGGEDCHRVSSAWITVDGTEVAIPDDFSEQVRVLERNVALNDQSALEVTLASRPSSCLTLNVFGTSADHTAPSVTVAQPADGATVADSTPLLLVRYQDAPGTNEPAAAGVDTTSLAVTLDGADWTGLFTLRSDEASADLPEDLALAEGPHTLHASVEDRAGNAGEVTADFQVDLTPPAIQVAEPAGGAVLATASPSVRVQYADNLGLDFGSLQVTIDGEDRTSLFAAGPTEAVATLEGVLTLPSGANQVVARIRDRGGNESVATVTFTVDVTPPTLAIGSPAAGARLGTGQVDVLVQYADDQALDLASLEATIDGSPATLSPSPAWAMGTLGPLADGAHHLAVAIADSAGNRSEAAADFSVDTTAPDLQVLQPAPGSLVATATPLVLVLFSDAQGVDRASLRITVNGVDRTGLFTVEDGDAYLELPPESALPEGESTVAATVSDLTGNASSAGSTFTVDTLPPAGSVLAPPARTNTHAPALQIEYADATSGVDPASVHVFVDGTERTDLLAVTETGASGLLLLDPPLADGAHAVHLTLADRAGHAATIDGSFTVDTVAPTASFTAPANDSFINDQTPEIHLAYADAGGTGVDPASVRVFLATGADGAETEITSVFQAGLTEAVGALPAELALADGTHHLRAEIADQAGNLASAAASFELDTVVPTATVDVPSAGAFVATATPFLTVRYGDDRSGIDPASLQVSVDGQDRTARLTAAADSASGTLAAEDALVDGVHRIDLTVRDRAGNAATVANHTFVVDTTAPHASIDLPTPGSYVGEPLSEVRVSYGDTDAGAGNGVDPLSVRVTIDGADQTAAFTFGPDAGDGTLETPLMDGAHSVRVDVLDWAGNPGSAEATFFVDTTPPSLPQVTPVDGVYLSEVDAAGTLRVSGTVQDLDPAVTIECRVGDVVVGATVTAGQFTCDVPLAEGANQLSILATDGTGHQSELMRSFNLDTMPPQVTIDSPPDGVFTNATTLDVAGHVSDASPVRVQVEGVEANVQGGLFVAPGVPLGDGPDLTLHATATDAAGNGSEASVHLRIDRVSPVVRITSLLEGAYVKGPVVEVSGTLEDDSPAIVDVNGEPSVVTGGTFAASVPVADGVSSLQAVATDAAGNASADSVSVTIDTAPPIVSLTSPAEGAVTREASLHFAGMVADTSPATLRIDGTPVSLTQGEFAHDAPLPAEGPRTFTLEATDAAGNTATLAVSVVVDRTPPALTVVTPAEGGVVGALPVVVQGTVADASAVTVTVDDVPVAQTAGAWQAQFGSLLEGPHGFVVVATDAAGNQSSLTRTATIDLTPPILTVTAPENGSLTREAAVLVQGTVEDRSAVSLTVNGSPAAVSGGAFEATVPLTEGDNSVTVAATDATGRSAIVDLVVTRDSTPPVVDLTVPETISRGRPGQAIAAVTDDLAVAEVRILLEGELLGTFTAPPYEVALTVPEGAGAGDTLTVTATATDRAGNLASVSKGVRVAADGVIVGEVLSDATSLPLEGARARLVSGSEPRPEAATDARGRYSIPTAEAQAVLVVERDGMTLVERAVGVESGVGTVPVDARLTALADPVTVGPAGGTLAAGGLTVVVAPGSVSTDLGLRLTPLSTQGLPGLLPLGWSPLAAIDLRADGPVGAGLELTATDLTASTVHLVAYDMTTHAWIMVAPGLAVTNGAASGALPGLGTYALVAPDLEDPPLPVPAVGAPLGGVGMVSLPPDAVGTGTVEPSVVPPTGGTAVGRLSVQSSVALPSGTVVQADVSESFTLSSGDVASGERRLQDIVLYRPQPDGSPGCDPTAALCASFPITPSRSFEATALSHGEVVLDILAGREAVRGRTGGSEAVTLEAGEARLAVPAQALAEDTALDLESQALSAFLPSAAGLVPLSQVGVDFSGHTLGMPAELSVTSPGVPEGDTLLVARVVQAGGVTRLTVVGLAQVVAGRIVSQPYPGLPGVTQEGEYVFYRSAVPVGFVSGVVSSGGTPVKAVVTTAALPFVAQSAIDGHYLVAAAAGGVTVSATVPGTSLQGGATGTVQALATTPLDLTLSGIVTTASVAPPDGASGLPTNVQLSIETTAALNPATATAANVQLYQGAPADGVAVPVRLVLSGSGRTLAVIPEQALAFSTTYTLQASGLADVFGGLVAVPATAFETKADTPPVYDLSAVELGFPDQRGIVPVTAPAGTLPPGTQILLIDSGNGVVVSLTAGNDGSVDGELPASLDDRILVTVTDPLGNSTTFERGAFVAPDGTTAVNAGGGTVAGPGGVELQIPAGALDRAAKVRISAFGPDVFPERPDLGTDEQGNPKGYFGSGLKIESPDQPVFKKEVRLVFPLPDFSSVPEGERPPDPADAFYSVYRKVDLPDGGGSFFETLDFARIEGEGADRKLVTASPPFSGYVDSYASYLPSTGAGLPVSTAYAFTMWSYNRVLPGNPSAGVVTGRVVRPVFQPGAAAPSYEGVASVYVGPIDANGNLVVDAPPVNGPTVAKTQADGRFTLFDARFDGGTVEIGARAPDGQVYRATAYAVAATDSKIDSDPGLLALTQFGLFQNVAFANITLPGVEAPPAAPKIEIHVMGVVDGARRDTNGVVIVGTPLLIGFRTEGTITGATVQGTAYGTGRDDLKQTSPSDPLAMDAILQDPWTPTAPGAYTVTATALPAFGSPVTSSLTFRVVAEGGSATDPAPGPPGVIEAKTIPARGATGVSTSVFPQVVFTEPVEGVSAETVHLIDPVDGQSVPATLLGVGPGTGGNPEVITGVTPTSVVTAVTLQPLALRPGTEYTIEVTDGAVDLDQDSGGNPAPNPLSPAPYQSTFSTYAPQATGASEDLPFSPSASGLVVLGDRAYLLETDYAGGIGGVQNGQLRVYDLADPALPVELPEGRTPIAFPPRDVAGEAVTEGPFAGRKLVAVAAGSRTSFFLQGEQVFNTEIRSTPASLFLYDVTEDVPRWIGAAILTGSLLDGIPNRVVMKDGRLYAATLHKGIQVVDLAAATASFPADGFAPGESTFEIDSQLSGQGLNQQAVVATIPVLDLAQPEAVRSSYPLPLSDLEVGDFVVEQTGRRLVLATGPRKEAGLVVADPLSPQAPLFQGAVASADGAAELDWGSAIAIATVEDRPVALVGGYGTMPDPAASGSIWSGGLLAVVDLSPLADAPRGDPQVLAFLPVRDPLGVSVTVGDILVRGRTAIVSGGATSSVGGAPGAAVLVDLDLAHPQVTGWFSGVGSRMAVSDAGLLFSTERSFIKSPTALDGVHVASLDAGAACGGLLDLQTPRVILHVTVDPVNGTRCGEDGHIVFGLCRRSLVSLSVDGSPFSGTVDGQPLASFASVPLDPGLHVVEVPRSVLGDELGTEVPFHIDAVDTTDGTQAQGDGSIESDLRNRSVLPVGHTFVKGVDLYDGHVVQQATDLKLPGRHLGLEVTRTYSSAAKGADHVLGAGWGFNYESVLTVADCGLYTVTTADGSSQTFRSTDGIHFTPQKGYHTKLARNDDLSYDFTDKSGTVHRFRDLQDPLRPGVYRLEYIEEPHGDRIVPTYGSSGRVTKVSEILAGETKPVRSLGFTYEKKGGFDRIVTARAFLGDQDLRLEVTYDYDTFGNLKTVVRTGKNLAGQPDAELAEWDYDYSSDQVRDRHQLTATVDPNKSRTEYRYYQASDPFPGEDPNLMVFGKEEFAKAVVEHPGGGQPDYETGFAYDYSQAASSTFTTVVNDARGNDTTYTLNGNGSPTLIVEPPDDQGTPRQTRMAWAPDDIFKTDEWDANDRHTQYGHDARGNLTDETIFTAEYPDGVTTHYAYDPTFNRLTDKDEAEPGHHTHYEIDPNSGDLLSMSDAVGNVTQYTYDSEGHGLLVSVTDPRGNATEYLKHDNYGNAREIHAPRGITTYRTYDPRGRLLQDRDSLGHKTATTYDGLDRVRDLVRVAGGSSDDDHTATTYYPGGQPLTVTNANGAKTTYTLDGLNRVTDTSATVPVPDGPSLVLTTHADYDGNGNKVLETDRRGVTHQLTYDKLNRLTQVAITAGLSGEGPTGVVAHYDYDLVGNKLSETDVAGRTTHYDYDGLYRVKTKTFPESDPATGLPYHEDYAYDKVGNRTSFVDRNRHETKLGYDGLNRLIDTENPLHQHVRLTYDDPGGTHVNKSEELDETRGLRTSYLYDELNRETSRTVALEGAGSNGETYTTRTDYDDLRHSRLVTGPEPEKRQTRVSLDGLDHVVESVVDPSGLRLSTLYAYDGLGNRKSMTDPNRNPPTVWRCDGLGRFAQTTDAKGNITHYTYDGGGLKTSEIDRRGFQRTFSYDNLGRPRVTTLTNPTVSQVPFGHETRYTDVAPHPTRTDIDARGHATVTELDGLDRVVKVTAPAPFGYTVESRYDGVNKRAEKDRRGNWTLFDYDELDRLTRTTDPVPFDAQFAKVDYLDAQNQKVETDRRNTPTVTQVDPVGRVLTVTRAGVLLEQNRYDGDGNKVEARDGEGKVTTFAYDQANRVHVRTDGFGTAEAGKTRYEYDANGNATDEYNDRVAEPLHKGYDALNRVTSTKDGEANETVYDYDPEGNRTLVKEPAGQETRFDYEEMGKLWRVTQPSVDGQALVTQYGYDENRNRIRQTDARGHSVEMHYDELDRLHERVQEGDLHTVHDYDANGNETSLTDPKQQVTSTDYDVLNRPIHKGFALAPGDSTPLWHYTSAIDYPAYDGNGNLLRVEETVASGTDPPTTLVTERTYDLLDRLESEKTTLPDGGQETVAYSYYANGTRKTVTDSENATTAYTYDGQNRLATATTAAGQTTYGYYPDDLLQTVTYPNGVTASYGYDKAGRLTSLENQKAGTVVSSYQYGYDPNGNRKSQVETNGGVAETTGYDYDALDRLTVIRYPTDAVFPSGRVVTYHYDPVGNRDRETETDASGTVLSDRQGIFDSINRLTALNDLLDPSESTIFGWDANGNQISKTQAGVTTTYFYDPRDKLVETQQGASVLARYQYDFEGRRTKKIGLEGIRQYVYDDTSLFAEYGETGSQVAKYDYGSDRLISLTRTDEGLRFFSFDGLRSVVNLTDDTGSAIASYHLDAWGNYRFPAELTASKNRFGFTGYYFDKETDLYFARARYLDPRLGRFLSQDSFLGNVDNPPSLHRYFYAFANPLRYTDPTGNSSWEQFKQDAWNAKETIRGLFVDTARKTYVGTGIFLARVVRTVDTLASPPHRRAPRLGLEPFSRKDIDAAKESARFTYQTLSNLRDTAPAALEAIYERGPREAGAAIGEATVAVTAGIEGGAALTRSGLALARRGLGALKRAEASAVQEVGSTGPAPGNVPAVLRISDEPPGLARGPFEGPARRLQLAPEQAAEVRAAATEPAAPSRGVRVGWREALGEGPESAAVRVTDARGAGLASRPRHHVFPQEYRPFFEERGFVGERSIDRFTIDLEESTHQAIHGGGNFRLGRKWAGEWNKRIMGEITRIEREVGRPLKFEEVMSVGEDLMNRYGLEGPYVPYRR